MNTKRMNKLKNITRMLVVALQFQIASSSEPEQRLESHFEGNFHADGSMFEVISKGQQIFISGFDVNMDAGTDTVSVYTRPGNLVPTNDGVWALIKTVEVEGQGEGLVTSVPDFTYPFIIPAGQKQSFYIATSSTDIDFWYSDGSDLGTVFASNADLEITEGYAIGHNWKGFASPRQWNGAVRYTVLAGDPTASPVVEPTGVPTASPVVEPAVSSSPSAAPSLKPSSYPSLPTSGFESPPTADATTTTQSPTKRPSKQPTQLTQTDPTASLVPTTTNFKEPRSITPKPTEAPASSSRRAMYSAWTAIIACLSLAVTKKWF